MERRRSSEIGGGGPFGRVGCQRRER